MNLLEAVRSSPALRVDPFGAASRPCHTPEEISHFYERAVFDCAVAMGQLNDANQAWNRYQENKQGDEAQLRKDMKEAGENAIQAHAIRDYWERRKERACTQDEADNHARRASIRAISGWITSGVDPATVRKNLDTTLTESTGDKAWKAALGVIDDAMDAGEALDLLPGGSITLPGTSTLSYHDESVDIIHRTLSAIAVDQATSNISLASRHLYIYVACEVCACGTRENRVFPEYGGVPTLEWTAYLGGWVDVEKYIHAGEWDDLIQAPFNNEVVSKHGQSAADRACFGRPKHWPS